MPGLLFYNAKMRGMPVERTEMEASFWVKRYGDWKNTFLHEVAK